MKVSAAQLLFCGALLQPLALACSFEEPDSGDPDSTAQGAGSSSAVVELEFESSNWWSDWSINNSSQTSQSNGYRGSGLRTRIPAGAHYGANLSLYTKEHFGGEPENFFFRYYLRFGDPWAPTIPGKIPGPADLGGTSRCMGGKPPTSGSPCWSARMMWRPADDGTNIGFYTYHLDQDGIYGDSDMFDADGVTPLENGRWYCVEGQVAMNEPGQANGVLRGWINGKRALERKDLRFRDSSKLKVERFWYDIYYGGKPTAPSSMNVYVDRLALGKERLGCDSNACDPMWVPGAEDEVFKDMPPDAFGYSAALKLFDSGITQGCRQAPDRMFCPRCPLTRSQMAAFLTRALKLPSAQADHFDDDAGSTFEDSHNRLFEAGITKGCGERAFCGTDRVTREQMAAFLTRALDLPSTTIDYFVDDSGQFEDAINALAEAGITLGCNPPENDQFCPKQQVTRAQTAIFLVRALGL